MDLTTKYLGLSLRSPLVPSASPLSEKIDNVRAMEQAGAAAVVFHSLFEEQIEATAPEFRVDPNTYLENIAQAKRAVGIPIIASLNCTTLGGWISYARRITEAGADALELNIYKIPTRHRGHREHYRRCLHRHCSQCSRCHQNPARGEIESLLQ